MWRNTETATNLQNRENIPTLVLNKYIKSPISKWSDRIYPPVTLPCLKTAERLTTSILAEFLDIAGEKRFLAKATRFQLDLAQTEAGQCLYQGIMTALGYAKNKIPFLALAHRLPLQLLEAMAQGKISDEESLARQQALLLGTAGLLPSQRPNWYQETKPGNKWIDTLERLWTSYHQTEAMSETDWHLFKVRPNNSPIRRIVAMSYLILRYRERGILEEIVNMIEEVPVSKGHHRLEKELMVTTNGYWARRLDFGVGSKSINPTLLGSSRAADIAVNVLLPFTLAWSRVTAQPELERKASDLYHSYPRLAVNSVERHMRHQLGLSNSMVNSARRQQGLIHIYNSLCIQGSCNSCPLGEAGVSTDKS